MKNIEPVFTPPDVQEMVSRIELVTQMMSESNLDYYIAACPDNVFYLTNFANYVHERPFILVVSRAGLLSFVVPKLEIPHVKTRSIGNLELVSYFEFPAPEGQGWQDKLSGLLEDGSRIGYESTCQAKFLDALPEERHQIDIIDDIRLKKSNYEISRILYASDLASNTFNQLLADAKPGQTLVSVSSQIRAMMLFKAISDFPSTNMLATNVTVVFQPPSVSHDPHNFTDVNMVMEEGGPHVAIINGTINGYGTEVERTYFLGHVPEAAKRPYEVMMQARRKAFELTVPGASMSEVDRQVNDVFKLAGYGSNLLHRTGHGIGVTGHEAPFLAEGYEKVIEPGMVFTIEPGVYIEGIGGFRHSDTVLVTETGNMSLTPIPDSIEDMTIDCNKA